MARFTLEDKLNAVLTVINGENSIRGVARELCTPKQNVHNWLAYYEAYGVEGLRLRCTNISGQFKLDVLNYIEETGSTLLQTAVRFRIPSPTLIISWRKVLLEQGADALFSLKKGRPSLKKTEKKQITENSNEALQARIKFLEMENEYLKKLNALVQKEELSKIHIKRK